MKTLIRCAICTLFFSILLIQIQAQDIDNPQKENVIVEMTPYDLKAIFDLKLKVTAALVELDASKQILSANMPLISSLETKSKATAKNRPVRIKGALKLEHNGNCYQIGCAKANCNKCGLFWWDRNKDGKVQPRKELRCVCKESKSQCELRGREIDCD